MFYSFHFKDINSLQKKLSQLARVSERVPIYLDWTSARICNPN